MKNKAIIIVTIIVISIVCSLTLTSCATIISPEKAFDILQKGVQEALDATYYFYDEVDNRNEKESINRKVNIIGKVDGENNAMQDENKEYIDYKASLYEKTSSKKAPTHVLDYKVGLPDKSEEGAVPYLIKRDATDKSKDQDRIEIKTRKEMTTKQFVESEFFADYSLYSKVKDLKMLTLDDIDLDATWKQSFSKEGASFTEQMYLVSMKFVIKPEFFEEHCPDSALKGDMIHIEVVDGKLNNIIVYQYVSDGSITTFDEVYRFSTVYRGPKVEIPKLSDLEDEKDGYTIVESII